MRRARDRGPARGCRSPLVSWFGLAARPATSALARSSSIGSPAEGSYDVPSRSRPISLRARCDCRGFLVDARMSASVRRAQAAWAGASFCWSIIVWRSASASCSRPVASARSAAPLSKADVSRSCRHGRLDIPHVLCRRRLGCAVKASGQGCACPDQSADRPRAHSIRALVPCRVVRCAPGIRRGRPTRLGDFRRPVRTVRRSSGSALRGSPPARAGRRSDRPRGDPGNPSSRPGSTGAPGKTLCSWSLTRIATWAASRWNSRSSAPLTCSCQRGGSLRWPG